MTIPIVFAIGADPVALGLVASFNHPGANVTGVGFQTVEMTAKRLQLLRELAPQATRFVALVNPKTAFTDAIVKDLQASAPTLGLPLEILNASTLGEIDAAFADLAKLPGCALLVSGDPFFTARRAQIVTLAARYALPAIYNIREYRDVGGLISYGPSFVDVYRQVGMYAGRIFKGEKPADLPVMQPTKFRAGDQSQNRQGTRHHRAANPASFR
jgi:putative ABC transport system substrate-binding protein